MLSALMAKVADPHFIVMALAAIAAAATVLTLAMPLVEGDVLNKRMKAVALEREQLRARERERLARQADRPSLRQAPKAYMKQIVDQFQLGRWLGAEHAKSRLTMAGYRGPQAEVGFLFFRLVTPIVLALVALAYAFLLWDTKQPFIVKMGCGMVGAFVGIKLPEVFIKNQILKRQQSMRRAFPDALDLLLICVESGMSIEQAFRRVSQEIGTQSVPLAEELSLTTAELSFLQDRRLAFENLAARTGLEPVKSVCQALVQAEKYGTPVGQALRVLSQESRDERMIQAEKKAASLPPKLTVPMILFFLPVLLIVILIPAAIQVFKWP
ncbi:type II secretion system F family protein [Alsobacter sp. SYSU M60028]|uniref:Type II secretion system F family protein n=1 Tax=Alsobacter ponti TaxID=2962936 RepID=A0ABT1LAP7_9HYPH|nr:type II secretion system F family protein [Alsobacter ponti]MCP8938143.1 type II secretion system F family protein [Alsobacter ponti]